MVQRVAGVAAAAFSDGDSRMTTLSCKIEHVAYVRELARQCSVRAIVVPVAGYAQAAIFVEGGVVETLALKLAMKEADL